MSVSLKSNTGSTFPEASLPSRRARISLPSLPSKALGRDPEDSVPLAWSNPASGSAFITCSSAPHGHRCRAAASLRGREAPATAAAAARPPSLPPSVSPSLPLSLPRALPLAGPSRGQPVLDQIQVSPKKERTSYVEKKERPLTAFLFHALSLGGPRFPRPGLGSAPAEVCGACCLAHADRRALRTACCTLWAVTPGSPNTTQTQGPSYRLNIRLPATLRASVRSPLRSVRNQSPQAIHLVRALVPGPDTPPRQGARRNTLGLRSCPRLPTFSPAWNPHKAPCPDTRTRSPKSPPPLPFTCS